MAIYFLKLGGSVITDVSKPYTAKRSTIKRILNEIKQAMSKKKFSLVIGHGGGSFPHIPASKYKVNDGLVYDYSWKGAAITHLVAAELNQIVTDLAIKTGISAFPFAPSSFGIWEANQGKELFASHIRFALAKKFVPIVYGDAVLDYKKGVSIASTESVFELLSKELKPKKVILATDVDGVFDKDPKVNKDAKLVKRIDSRNINEILKGATGSHKIDVTGGMFSKLKILYNIVSSTGSIGIITNGNKEGAIFDALTKQPETLEATVIKR